MAPAVAEDDEQDENHPEAHPPGDDGEIRVQEEAADLKTAPAPIMPPPAIVEEHRVTYIPYRSWCDECARGRGLGEQRGRHTGRAHEIPRVGVDYWYITTGGLKQRKELAEVYPQTADGDAALEQARAHKELI